MAEPAVTASVGLLRWVWSGFLWAWHKITGVEPLIRRIEELEKTNKEKTDALLARQEKASEEIKATDLSVAEMRGSISGFTKLIDLVREDLDKQDARIDGKVKDATWDEVQRMIKLREELMTLKGASERLLDEIRNRT
jgi:predicted  nucleic acid-binding Zn-ribbon protein